MSSPTIGFVGLTHLGLNSATAAAERGFEVVCLGDASLIARLRELDLPVSEPDLTETFTKNKHRLHLTSNTDALSRCDLVYIAPDVSTDDQGHSDLGPLREHIAIADRAMRPEACMVVLSQVPPGFTRRLPRDKTRLFYQVETLIFGRAMERALHPERFIVGAAKPSEPLPQPFAEFLQAFGCPILPMRYESAELAKIAINCCLVASIGVANTLAELCEEIGADWSEIVPALRLDKRIGPHAYLVPGLGIAGGNLERDLATVCRYGYAYGTDVGVIHALSRNSVYRRNWALAAVHDHVISRVERPVIAIWGLAYKENTDSIKNSPSIALIEALKPFALRVHDPVVPTTSVATPTITPCAHQLDACKGADALVIMTPWQHYRATSPGDIARRLKGRIVIDPFSVLDAGACRGAGLSCRRLGLGECDELGALPC